MPRSADDTDLRAILDEYHRALDAFFRGDSGPVKPLFSRQGDATLANPFGPPRRGWTAIEEAMDRAAATYADGGALGFDEISRLVGPELTYLVEIERYEAKVGGSPGDHPGVPAVHHDLPPRAGWLEDRASPRGSDHGGSGRGVRRPDIESTQIPRGPKEGRVRQPVASARGYHPPASNTTWDLGTDGKGPPKARQVR